MNQTRSIVCYFKDLPDSRRGAGQRHEQSFVLLLVLMSTMSGQGGYRAIGDFIKRNSSQIISTFKPAKNRLPTFYTVRRVIQGLDFREISKAFSAWAAQYVSLSEGEWISADGKALNGTITNARDTAQQFQSLVSLYCSRRQLSLANASVTSSKQSESIVFRELLAALDLSDVTITLDALHCQKKQPQQ